MFDKEVELNDLYYGKTLYGWELVCEDVKEEDILNAQNNLKINIIKVPSIKE